MSNTSLEKSKIRILLLEGVHQSAIDTLNAAGYTNIEYLTHSLSEEDLIEKIADAHFVGIRSRTQLTEKVFDAAKKLVAVGCFLHRHQPGEPAGRHPSRHRRVQRALLQYPERCRAGSGSGDPAAARRTGEKRQGPPG